MEYSEKTSNWDGRVLMITTVRIEEGHWETVVFPGVMRNWEDNDENSDIDHTIDYEHPIKRVSSQSEQEALDAHIGMIRNLPFPELERDLTKYDIDYIC